MEQFLTYAEAEALLARFEARIITAIASTKKVQGAKTTCGVKEAAAILSVGRSTIHRMIKDGTLETKDLVKSDGVKRRRILLTLKSVNDQIK